MANFLKSTDVNVRGVEFKLMAYTRSLELCSRMNYETENLDFIDKIPANDILFDLGACEGRFSIYAAKKGVRVYAFEPEQKNFSVLRQNIDINFTSDDNIKIFNYGVGKKDGKAIINIGQPWEGGHQKVVEHDEIRNDLNFNFVEKQEIELIAIDSIINKGKCLPPNYLKIDIDGSEMPFIEGAIETLNSDLLKAIIFELCITDPNFEEIISILKKFGFEEHSKFLIPNEPNLYNFIFLKKS